MQDFVRFSGTNQAVEIFGTNFVGINAENGKKFLFSLVFVVAALLLGRLLQFLSSFILRSHRFERIKFWARQAIRLATAVLVVIGIISFWFDDPTRLATALGLVTAGLAFAFQKLLTSVAGYFVILRGKIFNVGDRIVMGSVRGDVIALGFTQTTIMEMGQPPSVQGADPSTWVQSRQYTGRIVTVSNARIFDDPVYNYTREFPYLWEEMVIPISYTADRTRAERIMLDAAGRHTVSLNELSEEAIQEMQRRYLLKPADIRPRVYYRLTDNWLELTVRFIAKDHGIREQKDAMSREILQAMNEAGIGIASATLEIVGLPPLQIKDEIQGK